jgi:NAD(P)-dependent dehydrogenase (short-subunit alcohol dehydrogenase family)
MAEGATVFALDLHRTRPWPWPDPGAGRLLSSVHAIVSEPNAAPYTATKGGLEAMTRTLASELAPHGITVNCVRPGATKTKMSEPIMGGSLPGTEYT